MNWKHIFDELVQSFVALRVKDARKKKVFERVQYRLAPVSQTRKRRPSNYKVSEGYIRIDLFSTRDGRLTEKELTKMRI